ncbi:LOW QUALITY PROTEIN: hypothetical protein HZS_3653 [Henneguya salminicola]|nr:LOW QUALITY PROTEIN: hypothetical protein HZS_3653 [Henneguya salminicola]
MLINDPNSCKLEVIFQLECSFLTPCGTDNKKALVEYCETAISEKIKLLRAIGTIWRGCYAAFLYQSGSKSIEARIFVLRVRRSYYRLYFCNSNSPPRHFLYEHEHVNHSGNFIDAHTRAHTNTIEGTCKALRMKISSPNITNFYDEEGNLIKNCLDDFLWEFLWPRRHSRDLCGDFFNFIIYILFIRY